LSISPSEAIRRYSGFEILKVPLKEYENNRKGDLNDYMGKDFDRRRTLIETIRRNLGLFGIALLMAYGFVVHREFYALDPITFFLGGTLLVFMVIKTVVWLSTPSDVRNKYSSVMIFDEPEVDPVRCGSKNITVLPADSVGAGIRPGMLVEAKLSASSSRRFAGLAICQVEVGLLGDISEGLARQDRSRDLMQFRHRWIRRCGDFDLFLTINVVSFDAVD
jgi:hypothetical protein